MEALNHLAKYFMPRKAVITSVFFKLHYRLTFVILLFSCTLVSVRQTRNDAINCIKESDVSSAIMEKYCWISSTYSVFHPNDTSKELPYVGVRNSGSLGSSQLVRRHAYYQWVPLILFLQAITFYAPYYVWKRVESSHVSNLVSDFHGAQVRQRIATVAEYFCIYHNHRTLYQMIIYLLCEMANFANITLQISFLNYFLSQEYESYGSEYLDFAKNKELFAKMNPMSKLFPHVTKCTFYSFGPSGDVEKIDTLCVLMVNVLNEKIFLFLWFYFRCLYLFTAVGLFYTVLHLAVVKHTPFLMNFWLQLKGKPLFYRKQALRVFSFLSYPDYFKLHLILENLSIHNGYYLLKDIEELLHTDKNSYPLV